MCWKNVDISFQIREVWARVRASDFEWAEFGNFEFGQRIVLNTLLTLFTIDSFDQYLILIKTFEQKFILHEMTIQFLSNELKVEM